MGKAKGYNYKINCPFCEFSTLYLTDKEDALKAYRDHLERSESCRNQMKAIYGSEEYIETLVQSGNKGKRAKQFHHHGKRKQRLVPNYNDKGDAMQEDKEWNVEITDSKAVNPYFVFLE